MSEQEKEKRKSSVSTIVATVIVAVAAAAALIVLIVMTKKSPESENRLPDDTAVMFRPTQEFVDECGEHAQELVAGNYRVVRLYISEGLAHLSEPYGNRPEDGLYTADSDEFRTYEQVESLVRSVYVEEEADRILTRMPSDPAGTGESSGDVPEFIAVYGARDIFVDLADLEDDVSVPKVPEVVIPPAEGEPTYVKKSVLGISEYFKPDTGYKKPWGSTSIRIIPISEDECDITVYLGADKDVDLSSVEETDILSTKMLKTGDEWRLTELIY